MPLVSSDTFQLNSSHETLSSRVARRVRALIREGRLRPGDPLPSESSLADELAVSRQVVREAYQSMSALGLLEIRDGRRARVAKVDNDVLALVIDHGVQTDQVSVQQILDVRRTIEMRTVTLAALRRTEVEGRRIADLAAAMRRDFFDADAVMEHDIAFHEAIAEASRNPMFNLIVGSFHVVTRQTWRIGWVARDSDDERMESVAGHEAIAAAILEGNRASAEALMAAHFDITVKILLASGIN